jgi:hypothetical protein
VGPRAGLNGCGKSRPPPGFDPRTVQNVASRCTDCATPATFDPVTLIIIIVIIIIIIIILGLYKHLMTGTVPKIRSVSLRGPHPLPHITTV